MMPDERPFTPEEVDEQIDRSYQRGAPSSPGQQLVDDLQALYSAETTAMSRAIARGRERLAQSRAVLPIPQHQHNQVDSAAHVHQERQNPMKPKPLVNLSPPDQLPLSRLGGLVAMALLVVVVGSLVAALVLVRAGKTTTGIQAPSSLKGGVEIDLMAACDVPVKQCTANELKLLAGASVVLKGRIADGLGIAQPVVQQQGSDEIVVDLPPQVRTQDALDLLTPIGKLDIIDTGLNALPVGSVVTPGQYPVVFTGDQFDSTSIRAILNGQRGYPAITFRFKSQYQTAFADYTQQNISNYLTVTLDNKVIDSAVIEGQITGQAEITGHYTLADAQETAALIRYGSLPLPLTVVNEQTITT